MSPFCRFARVGLLASALIGLAACGTTVSTAELNGTGSQSGLGGGGLGATQAGSSAAAGAPGLVTDGQAGAVVSASGQSGGAAAAFGASGAGGAGQALATAAAPGISATGITIGLPYTVNGAAANSAAGGAGITQGDEKGELSALIDDINSHGGVLGRRLVPIWHAVDALSNDSIDSQFQSMCSDFTQDHHVFAMFIGASPIIEQCAQKAGAVAIYENLSVSSSRTFARFPSYVEVSMLDLDRMLLNEAISLARQNYFAPWDATTSQPAATGHAKVGIVTYDTPDYHYAIDKVLQPELGRLGHAAASQDVIYLPPPQRTSDLSSVSADEANAIVKLRQDGVEHVLIADDSGTLTLEFLNDAESQHYYPRYGWNSQNAPEALESPGDVQPDQLNGSMGIGFAPGIDLTAADNPDNGPYSNAARRKCLAFLGSKGFTFSDANSKTVGELECGTMWFFRQVMDSITATVNQASFIDAVNHLGSSFESPTIFSTFFSAAQHDGGGSYYDYYWNNSCTCMRYRGSLHKAVGEGER